MSTIAEIVVGAIKESLPEECELTAAHALVHVSAARKSGDDPDQVAHDLDIAERILTALAIKEQHGG